MTSEERALMKALYEDLISAMESEVVQGCEVTCGDTKNLPQQSLPEMLKTS